MDSSQKHSINQMFKKINPEKITSSPSADCSVVLIKLNLATPLTGSIHCSKETACHPVSAFEYLPAGKGTGRLTQFILTSQVRVELLTQDASVQGSAGLGQPPGFQFY